MKRIITFTVILMMLTTCAAPQAQPTPDTASTDILQANMPNPASVYCIQQDNRLKIITAADSSQSGQCVFPDGNACDEWAYFQGECRPAVVESITNASVGGNLGVIKDSMESHRRKTRSVPPVFV